MTGASGELLGVAWARSSQYLTRPVRHSAVGAEITHVERAHSGVLDITHGTRLPLRVREFPAPVDPTTARVVTLDHSVVLSGLDPARFGPDDALFVSAAVALEMAVTLGTGPAADDEFIAFGEWNLSTPVPIDDYVLRIYAQLCSAEGHPLRDNAALDRTDLVGAATAILYDAPLYTTKPEAYRGLRNGLKVIAYGPVRNRATLVPPPPPDPFRLLGLVPGPPDDQEP